MKHARPRPPRLLPGLRPAHAGEPGARRRPRRRRGGGDDGDRDEPPAPRRSGLRREAELGRATPLDMIVALRARVARGARHRAGRARPAPRGRGRRAGPRAESRRQARPGTVAEALEAHPDANLVSVAVPGPYAAFVAHRALDAGRSVFLFSDNVPLADEVALKRRAAGLGLLVMGPDCGTAILSGVGLGFANRVERGPVGIVGASGTGIQELSCLLDRRGVGVSHAIGTGSRDLSDAVDGAMTETGLGAPRARPGDEVRPPRRQAPGRERGAAPPRGPRAARQAGRGPLPGRAGAAAVDGVLYAGSLDEAAEAAATWAGAPPAPAWPPESGPDERGDAVAGLRRSPGSSASSEAVRSPPRRAASSRRTASRRSYPRRSCRPTRRSLPATSSSTPGTTSTPSAGRTRWSTRPSAAS